MKKIIGPIVLIFAILVTSCANQQKDESADTKKQEQQVDMNSLVKTTLQVEGMTCTGCEETIESELKEIAGVVEVKANHIDSTTYVAYDSTLATLAAIEEGITKVGYQVSGNQ